uniref:Ssu-2 homolog n=1 Tax=Pseudonaja textilis TaxID=8673 RepID=A0A670Y5L9_PSETE
MHACFGIESVLAVSLIPRFPRMTDDMARSALLSFVNSKCCYGNRAAGELLIQELKPQTFYRYRLKTFNETRVCEWTFEPYTSKSQLNSGITIHDSLFFRLISFLFQECHKCHGWGRYKCSGCHGGGRMRCVVCNGARKAKHLKYQKRCQVCSGTGRKRCNTCSGRGNKTCSTCQGMKKLLHFIQLIITWKNNVYEFISEQQLSFPRDLLSNAMGENVLKDENTLVYPLVDFPNAEISLASQRAIAEHHGPLTSTSRILRQVYQSRPFET